MDTLLPTAWHWFGAVLCAMLVGAAKSGIPGLGFLAVPWFAYLFHDRVALSAGALLPLLCCADLCAVLMFRRRASLHRLWHLLPWVLLGIGLGYGSLSLLDNATLRPLLGGIILALISLHLWREWHPTIAPPGKPAAALYGVTAGATTMIANAAGPVMNLYLLGQRLTKEELVATGAWFFFVVNLLKVPLFARQEMMTADTLLIDICLLPAVIVGALLGRRILGWIPQHIFAALVVLLAAAGAVLLLCPAA